MNVTMPDGTVIAGVPEGTTKSELMRRLGKMDATAPDVGAAFAEGEAHRMIPGGAAERPTPPREPSKAAGIPGAALTMASAIPAGIAGNVAGALRRVGGGSMTDAGKTAKAIATRLTYEPSAEGAAALDTAGKAFEASKLGGLNPAMPLPALAGVPRAAAAGEGAARGKAADIAARLTAEREAKAVTAAPRANILNRAADVNLTTLPADTNPTLLNRTLQGVAGTIKTKQQTSVKNAPVVNQLTQKRFGVEEPLVPSAVNEATGKVEGPMMDVRARAFESGYEPVRALGQIAADDEAFAALDALSSRGKSVAATVPDAPIAADNVTPLVQGLKQQSYDAGGLVDTISVLREEATKAFAGRDKSMGGAYQGAADALEGLIERHLVASGNQELYKAFTDARKVIAQSHVVEPTLTPGGNVNAQALAARGKKRPLTDELRVISDFAREQPDAVQPLGKIGGVPTVSPLDTGVGLMSSLKGAAAMLTGRPALRATILSPWYQKNFVRAPDYAQPGLIERIAKSVAGDADTPLPPQPTHLIPADLPPVPPGYQIPPVPYEPPNIPAMIAERLTLGQSPPRSFGNEIDILPFLQERAGAPAQNIEELLRRAPLGAGRTAPISTQRNPPASLLHDLQWLAK